jgi:hypothetical protein
LSQVNLSFIIVIINGTRASLDWFCNNNFLFALWINDRYFTVTKSRDASIDSLYLLSTAGQSDGHRIESRHWISLTKGYYGFPLFFRTTWGLHPTSHDAEVCFVLFAKYCSGDQIKENMMGRACSRHGRDKKCIQDVSRRTLREDTTWETNRILRYRLYLSGSG